MSDYMFVDGIGDEVVLFVGFLLLSVGFLIIIGFLRRGHVVEPEAERDPLEAEASTRQEEEASVVNTVPETEGLRHRGTGSVPGTSSYTSASNTPNADSLSQETENIHEDEQESTSNQNNSSFTIRLVIAGRTDRPKEVRVTASHTMEQIRNSHFQAELSQNCPVRFIYQGRLIPDETNVGSLGIAEGGAMHIHIGRPRPQGAPPTNVAPMQQLDLSQYFLPLLGLILGVVWMVMLMYPYVFTFFTKVFLFGLSFGYVVLTYFSTVGARN